MRTVKEIREGIMKWEREYNNDFGEMLCYHIHEMNMPFRILAEHFGISLEELAEVIADHIRRL